MSKMEFIDPKEAKKNLKAKVYTVLLDTLFIPLSLIRWLPLRYKVLWVRVGWGGVGG